MVTIGEHTLSACEDKELRSKQDFWVDRVRQVGNHKSPFMDTPQKVIDEFTRFHKAFIDVYLRNTNLLEFGCGYGRCMDLFSVCKSYTGVDFVPELIKEAEESAKKAEQTYHRPYKVLCENIRDLPFDDNQFDAAVGIAVVTSLEHNFHDVLKELKRVVRVGGLVVFLEEEWVRFDDVR